jgi:hypothetical protein
MYYAILAYHLEGVVDSWTPEEDAALMTDLLAVNDRLVKAKKLGPAARLGPTSGAVTLRGPGAGVVIDGPFAETKELVAGFWIIEVPSIDEAIEWVKRCPNPMPGESEIEIRPVFEMGDFGEAYSGEAAEVHDRVRDRLAGQEG